tara:strand:+ start:408 stop:950 length:543 start_codon:yes stop_codon:yes gene_type:complete
MHCSLLPKWQHDGPGPNMIKPIFDWLKNFAKFARTLNLHSEISQPFLIGTTQSSIAARLGIAELIPLSFADGAGLAAWIPSTYFEMLILKNANDPSAESPIRLYIQTQWMICEHTDHRSPQRLAADTPTDCGWPQASDYRESGFRMGRAMTTQLCFDTHHPAVPRARARDVREANSVPND